MPERAGRPFLILALAFLALLLGSNLSTPLYAVFRERFGFSSARLSGAAAHRGDDLRGRRGRDGAARDRLAAGHAARALTQVR